MEKQTEITHVENQKKIHRYRLRVQEVAILCSERSADMIADEEVDSILVWKAETRMRAVIIAHLLGVLQYKVRFYSIQVLLTKKYF